MSISHTVITQLNSGSIYGHLKNAPFTLLLVNLTAFNKKIQPLACKEKYKNKITKN